MSFFINPFKRHRAADEVEMGAALDILAPETPPTCNDSILGRDSPPNTQAHTAALLINNPSSAQVRAKAAYFESIIQSRACGTTGPGSDNKSTGSDIGESESCGIDKSWRLHASGMNASAAVDALRIQLERAEAEKKAALDALQRKTQEVENLTLVVREISESRAAALTARTSLAERYLDLQRDHARVARIADLSRTVSKENLQLTRTARGAAAVAEKEAIDAKREAGAAASAEHRAAEENACLREKISLLERLGLEQHAESVCLREFTAGRVCETY